MCSITDMCFMCTRNNNCSLVNDRIVSQIEYLLPEITIFKLGVPLRICCTCEKKLQSFNEFKNFCVGNSLRLEERIKKEQSNRDSTAHLLSDSSTIINDNTTVGPNSNVEDISIKEEPCEETSDEREYYNNVVKNMTETDCATDNDENCNKNNQICTKYDTEDKSAIPGTSDQQFEEIYIKPEIEDGSMDFENCDDVLMTETIENNQNALSKSGNTSSVTCKCSYNCKDISKRIKLQLRRDFMKIENRSHQNTFLLPLLSIAPIRRRRNGTYDIASNSRRQCSFFYFVPNTQGGSFQVCKQTFKNIFGVSNRRLQTIQGRCQENAVTFEDRRKYKSNGGRYTRVDWNLVQQHINQNRQSLF